MINRLTRSVFALLLFCALLLSGCDGRQTSFAGAGTGSEAILQEGCEQMESWMAANCPDGTIETIENVVWKIPGGAEQLLDAAKGTISAGSTERDFFFDLKTGEAYLQPGSKEYAIFQRECVLYTLQCLGIYRAPAGAGLELNNALFYIALVRNMENPDQDVRYWWGIDGYATTDYVKLPGQLVLARGSVKEYVRDSARREVICVELDARVPEGVELRNYTIEQLASVEEEHGLHFKALSLSNDTGELSIVWDGDERMLPYDDGVPE